MFARHNLKISVTAFVKKKKSFI